MLAMGTLSQLAHFAQADLRMLTDILGNTAPATLKKHMGPWLRWPAAPSLHMLQEWTTSFQDKQGLKSFKSMLNFVF